MNPHNDLPPITPAKGYTAPGLPTLEGMKTDPAPLMKLPMRWKKNAAAVACIGLVGVTTLTGCFPIAMLLHGGGAGGAPIYTPRPTEQDVPGWLDVARIEYRSGPAAWNIAPLVAHIAEPDIFHFLQVYMESEGLIFSSAPPDYAVVRSYVEFGRTETLRIGIDLFDEEKNVAIVHIGWGRSMFLREQLGYRFIGIIKEELMAQADHLNLFVFVNPGTGIWGTDHSVEERNSMRALFIQNINAQLEDFVAELRNEGILD